MTGKIFAALALSTVLPFAVLAQTMTAPVTPEQEKMTNQNNARGRMADVPRSTQATTEGAFITVPGRGAWKVSDLKGKSVYTSAGESIGRISDVLVSQDGSINAVILGVGGFLGINEKDVAVDFSALQLGQSADQQAARSPFSEETTASTDDAAKPAIAPQTNQETSGSQSAANRAKEPALEAKKGDDGLPQRIVLNVTREQLEQAPAFQGMTPAR